MTTQAGLERAKPKLTMDEILETYDYEVNNLPCDAAGKAKAAIIELIKAEVPEEKPIPEYLKNLMKYDADNGWNSCRQKMLERLEAMR